MASLACRVAAEYEPAARPSRVQLNPFRQPLHSPVGGSGGSSRVPWLSNGFYAAMHLPAAQPQRPPAPPLDVHERVQACEAADGGMCKPQGETEAQAAQRPYAVVTDVSNGHSRIGRWRASWRVRRRARACQSVSR